VSNGTFDNNDCMTLTEPVHSLDQLLDPVRECLTPDVAARIAALRASPTVQARLDLLAEKNKEETITDEERDEYFSMIQAMNLIAVLQAKARLTLNNG
jgi:hypothetical protein